VSSRSLALLALLAAGCVHHVRERCPTCPVVESTRPAAPRCRPGTRTLYVLVPGVLGWGWEWDQAVAGLRAAPGVEWVVYWWEPWQSLRRAGNHLRGLVASAIGMAPPSLREVVVVAHSAGGMVAARSIDGLAVPEGKRVTVVTIGAPLAGMSALPGDPDPVSAPAMTAVIGRFLWYPDPPPRVSVVEYVTHWPSDPVMQPHAGHQPAAPRVGPRGARRIEVDPKEDHNHLVSRVVLDLLRDRASDAKMSR